MVIDKAYFQANPIVYFRDFLLSFAVFIAAFVWGIQAEGWVVVVPYALAAAFLYRAGIFAHEIVHRERDPAMRTFYWVWQATCGAVLMLPSARFYGPHTAHHSDGIFRTKDDPQYLLVRSKPGLMLFVLLGLPLLTPIYTFLQVVIASLGGLAMEEALDRFTQRTFNFSVSTPLEDDRKAEVTWLSRYYLVLLVIYGFLLPETIGFYYAILVGGWLLTVLRIPLEHELDHYAESSDKNDQMYDSFTVESPLAVVIQPIGFRYHTAHHMYPGVPYHNLPALNRHLKETLPGYSNSVVSYWTVIRGPKYVRPDVAPSHKPRSAG
jgi:fatty acid desaturase